MREKKGHARTRDPLKIEIVRELSVLSRLNLYANILRHFFQVLHAFANACSRRFISLFVEF